MNMNRRSFVATALEVLAAPLTGKRLPAKAACRFPSWKHYTFRYTPANKKALIAKLRAARKCTKFLPPSKKVVL